MSARQDGTAFWDRNSHLFGFLSIALLLVSVLVTYFCQSQATWVHVLTVICFLGFIASGLRWLMGKGKTLFTLCVFKICSVVFSAVGLLFLGLSFVDGDVVISDAEFVGVDSSQFDKITVDVQNNWRALGVFLVMMGITSFCAYRSEKKHVDRDYYNLLLYPFLMLAAGFFSVVPGYSVLQEEIGSAFMSFILFQFIKDLWQFDKGKASVAVNASEIKADDVVHDDMGIANALALGVRVGNVTSESFSAKNVVAEQVHIQQATAQRVRVRDLSAIGAKSGDTTVDNMTACSFKAKEVILGKDPESEKENRNSDDSNSPQ
ncbi:hypothetical protein JS533_009220 [Bifidobacterium amazonense]|uniref:Uncharacterized protein n=1 Tax=Bifidobacterium amazonense TaxID=2809027 RepID=A0ABS9VWF8_9BIFI|nr:hypothetical protein [Bifidobacterium amazonense]MCH9276443.1 hypothetical protein [Bifidobacterium amazonense]